MYHSSDKFEFVGFGELAETTIQLLSLNLRTTDQSAGHPATHQDLTGIEQVEQYILQQVRDYLSTVREGFVLSVRSADVQDKNEARYLLDRVVLDWDSLSSELGLADSPIAGAEGTDTPSEIELVHQQLLAFGMTAVALGALPQLPANQITFPHPYSDPPSYADIAPPSTPGEMLVRIEELEEMVWQMVASDLGDLLQKQYGPVRRTYGFFETSAWLARKEAQRFGLKRNGSTELSFF
ncbi:MAG: hypothetical protein AAF702_29830 [Chloroflexota bacterium]